MKFCIKKAFFIKLLYFVPVFSLKMFKLEPIVHAMLFDLDYCHDDQVLKLNFYLT